MPVMGGIEATHAIRSMTERVSTLGGPYETEPFHQPPIVAMTANAVKGDRERFLAEGMDDYIAKPLRRKQLLELVEKWVSQSPGRPHIEIESQDEARPGSTDDISLPELEAAFERSGDRDEPSPTAADLEAPMDFETALEEFMGNREVLGQMLTEFLETVRTQIDKIAAAIDAVDAETVWREAHSIKGGAANLTAMDLSGTAAELETIGKSGDLDRAPETLEALENDLILLELFVEDILEESD